MRPYRKEWESGNEGIPVAQLGKKRLMNGQKRERQEEREMIKRYVGDERRD